MLNFSSSLQKKSITLIISLIFTLASNFWRSTRCFVSNCYYFLLIHVTPFCFQLFYFVFLSLLGFLLLKVSRPRSYPLRPRNLDLLFTSVSASTVSSMSTIEMEVFSNAQLTVLTLLMLVGGEVFTSMVGLHLLTSKLKRPSKTKSRVNVLESLPNFAHDLDMEMMSTSHSDPQEPKPNTLVDPFLKYRSIKFLGYLVSGYLVVLHVVGTIMLLAYLRLVSSASHVLDTKGIKRFTFAVFTIVSTFASCGFVPTNENMMVFRKNSGLLLILIPQVLLGNTLFPSCLRFSIWALGKVMKKDETNYLLRNSKEIKYLHLLPFSHSFYLIITVLGFVLLQFIMFCSMEWDSQALSGMNLYEKMVGVLFLCVNTRYTGETIVDISNISSAILVLFVVMMYIPPYTSFLPTKLQEECPQNYERKKRGKVVEKLMFSQLSYLLMVVIALCITERKSMLNDPLNFSVLNIVVEVISAYGNVGFTTGYSCDRRIQSEGNCTSKWFGFAGKLSDEGKVILIIVMVFGRLKKFSMNGGKAWKLL
ncbi:hypothetical protein V2J09_009565 [Rumex salicifolius]